MHPTGCKRTIQGALCIMLKTEQTISFELKKANSQSSTFHFFRASKNKKSLPFPTAPLIKLFSSVLFDPITKNSTSTTYS